MQNQLCSQFLICHVRHLLCKKYVFLKYYWRFDLIRFETMLFYIANFLRKNVLYLQVSLVFRTQNKTKNWSSGLKLLCLSIPVSSCSPIWYLKSSRTDLSNFALNSSSVWKQYGHQDQTKEKELNFSHYSNPPLWRLVLKALLCGLFLCWCAIWGFEVVIIELLLHQIEAEVLIIRSLDLNVALIDYCYICVREKNYIFFYSAANQ